MIKSLLVLGGGNAGLMTALYHKKSIDNLDITLIKSDKIGINMINIEMNMRNMQCYIRDMQCPIAILIAWS